MLQAGVATKEMDPQWMSSISWYVLCIFGLQPVINYLAGSDEGEKFLKEFFHLLNYYSFWSDGATIGPNEPYCWRAIVRTWY